MLHHGGQVRLRVSTAATLSRSPDQPEAGAGPGLDTATAAAVVSLATLQRSGAVVRAAWPLPPCHPAVYQSAGRGGPGLDSEQVVTVICKMLR